MLRRKNTCILFLLIFFSSYAGAQVTFQKSYDYKAQSASMSRGNMIRSVDGGYLVATPGFSGLDHTIALMKVDEEGNIEWSLEMDNNTQGIFDYECNVTQSVDGSIYIAYPILDDGVFQSAVLKLNSKGALVWSKAYGSNYASEMPENIFVYGNEIYLAGEIRFDSEKSNLFIMKLDTGGSLLWSKSYRSFNENNLSWAHQTSSGDIILSGVTLDSLEQEYAFITRIDTSSDFVWRKNFHTSLFRELNGLGICETDSGDLVFCGRMGKPSSGGGFGEKDILLMKLSAAGNFIWGKLYGGIEDDEAYSIEQTPDDGFLITTASKSLGSHIKIGLLKTDSIGNAHWMRLYGNEPSSFPLSALSTGDEGFFISGMLGEPEEAKPLVFIRTDSTGKSLCLEDQVILDEEDFSLNSFNQGNKANFSGQESYEPAITSLLTEVTLYCEEVGMEDVTGGTLFTLSPNPGNEFTLQLNNESEVRIYDLSGRVVHEFNAKAGIIIFGKELHPGMYLLDVLAGTERDVITLVKE